MKDTRRLFDALPRAGFALTLASLFVLAPGPQAFAQTAGSSVVINEFRLDGPNGLADEYVELINRTSGPVTITPVDDESTGWAVVNSRGEIVFVVPEGTVIPAGGTFTGEHETSSAPGEPDVVFQTVTPTNAGIALFATTNPQLFGERTRVDAVGSEAELNRLFVEGTGYEPFDSPVTSTQHALVRVRNANGAPQDLNDNRVDFARVSTTARANNLTAVLGSPNVDGLRGPAEGNGKVKASLVDPMAASTAAPNRTRDATPVENGRFGTLSIRRRFTNRSAALITQLRFRVIDVTTLNSPGYASPAQSDVRVLSSAGSTVVTTSGGTVVVRAAVLRDAEAHPLGGGLNSNLVVELPGGGLAPGASVNVEFRLGVERQGNFRFLVNVEALQDSTSAVSKTAARAK